MISTNGKPVQKAAPKMPKTALEAEKAVLGSMLIETAAAHEVASSLVAGDFYIEDHRKIFSAALTVLNRERALDTTLLMEELKGRKQLADIAAGDVELRGSKYLFSLTRSVSTAAFAASYATLVREASLDRQVGQQLKVTYETKTPENLKKLSDLMSALHGVRQGRAFDFRKDLGAALDALEKKPSDLVDTGFKSLDKKLGGLDLGDVTTIGARTSGGKTAMMVKLALQIAEGAGRECLYLTTEMRAQQIVERVLPIASAVPAWKFRKRIFDSDDWKKIVKTCSERLSKIPLKVMGKSTLSLADIRAAVSREKPRVLFVDYLQRCVFSQADTRAYQVMDFMKDLKTLAQETGINIFIGCQLSRALDHDPDKEPENSDLKDSGGIEAESDQVLLLWKPTLKRLLKDGIVVPSGQHLIRSKISKNRHGEAWHQADFLLHGLLVDICEHLEDEPAQRELLRKDISE